MLCHRDSMSWTEDSKSKELTCMKTLFVGSSLRKSNS